MKAFDAVFLGLLLLIPGSIYWAARPLNIHTEFESSSSTSGSLSSYSSNSKSKSWVVYEDDALTLVLHALASVGMLLGMILLVVGAYRLVEPAQAKAL